MAERRTLKSLFSWFLGGGALGENTGQQVAVPSVQLVSGVSPAVGIDAALQISTVWSCVDRRATTVASLPFFAYTSRDGRRELARSSRLFQLLHDSPNSRMTPFEFWRAVMLNHDLRGNGYARIVRDAAGEAVAMWPMAADQVEQDVLQNGTAIYFYRVGSTVYELSEQDVLHIKNLGNGITGIRKLEFMNATTGEQRAAQQSASKVFGNGGKPTGVLKTDRTLTKEQRTQLRSSMAELANGSESRLIVLEADLQYQQLSLSPEDQQLLESRQYGVEEICRWFDVPPVLVHHSNVTTWGSGIEQIVDGFHKFTIRPILVSIEQAVRKRVMTDRQRATMTAEFSLDALLRGNAKDRAELHAKNVQNGIMTRNEVRQLENLPPAAGADDLTAQSNLMPLRMLGNQPTARGSNNAAAQDPLAQ